MPEAKSKLLVLELWGLGDLMIATPFLRAAAERYDITLLAKPIALELQSRFWPSVKVVPFTAPWTPFKGKYLLWRWPWLKMMRLRTALARERFDVGLSGRWDPRDHFLLWLFGARKRLGFPRTGSGCFLTQPLKAPDASAHRYEYWRIAGEALGAKLPSRKELTASPRNALTTILVHTGARLPARIWPLPHWKRLTEHLRASGHAVQVVCDPNQLDWWRQSGEAAAVCPRTIAELLALIDQARIFIGNCSGPGHVAAICGVPTFTIFGPSLPQWFLPVHPAADGIEGEFCPFRPCADYCRYPTPNCLVNLSEEQVWNRVQRFISACFSPAAKAPSPLAA